MHHNSITVFVRQEVLNDEHLVQNEIITTQMMLLQSRQSTKKENWNTDPLQDLPQAWARLLSHLTKYSGSVQLSIAI